MSASSKPLTRRPALLKRTFLIVGIIAAVLVTQTLPMFILKPLGAREYVNKDVVVYYQPGDESGAREVFDLVTSDIGRIKTTMRYESSKPLEIYVYKTQSSLAITEAGFAALLIAPP